MSAIKISNITYKGWKNTIEISNLDIKVIGELPPDDKV